MQHPVIPTDPQLPIDQALQLALDNQADLVGFERNQKYFVAHRDDLSKMNAMGLSTLPVESVAVPETSPLLKGERTQLNKSEDYSRRLTAYFPVYFVAALYELQSLMQRFSAKAFVIGGITRDLLLYKEKRLTVKDVDMTVEGDALAFAAFLTENSRNFIVEEQFPEFGTAKVRYKDSLLFDFASTRQEIYPHCGALPVVVNRGVPLVNDIVRRDFTVNSLAFSIHELGHVLDYSNGIQDIASKHLRVLHPVSFFEDPSRILRAMKFCARFDFELGEETAHLLESFLAYGGQCYKGGGERIKQELKGFLAAAESQCKSHWIRFFIEKGCYRLLNMDTTYQPSAETLERLTGICAILPDIEATLSNYTDRDFLFDVYLCFFCAEMPDDEFLKTTQRLGLTRNEREFAEQFRKLKPHVTERFGALHDFSSAAEIYDLFHGIHFVTLAACLVELGFSNPKHMRTVLEAFLKYKRKWEKLQLELDGNDLINLGIPKGKQIGKLLDQLLHAKLAGQVPDRMDEIQYVQSQLETESGDSTDNGVNTQPVVSPLDLNAREFQRDVE